MPSFKGIMKGIGKVALKAAPFAAMAIPGIGPLASMAISAGTSAASKKLSGGSWKDALMAGGVGAGTSYLGGKIPLPKGLGPSSVGNVAKTAGKTSIKGILGNMGKSAATGLLTGQGGTGSSWKDIGKQGIDTAMNRPGQFGDMFGGGGGSKPFGGKEPSRIPDSSAEYPSLGLGPSPTMAYNPIQAGRREAIKNQPFRKGYDVITSPEEPAEGDTPMVPATKVKMPPIYSTGFGGGRRRNQNNRQMAMAR